MKVVVLGRFPPPVDGQSLATARLAELLDPFYNVKRINMEPPPARYVENAVAFRPRRLLHYLRHRSEVKRELSFLPRSPIVWTSISPSFLGHWRDVLTVAPGFRRDQRVIGVLHRSGFEKILGTATTRSSAKWLTRRLFKIVFLDKTLADVCKPWLEDEQTVVIPNTIDEELLFSEEEVGRKRDGRRDRDRLSLLFLSHMIPVKGYREVLNAAPLLREHGVPFEMHFVGRWGSEADRKFFDSTVSEYGLQEHVCHHGGIEDRGRVKEFYRCADVVLLPSYNPTEAQPIALIEGINAGIPIVATAHRGIPYIVRDGEEGIHVPPHSPSAVAEAVETLRDYPTWLRFSERARRSFTARFSPEHIASQWRRLLS